MRKILGLLGLFFLTVTSSDVYAAEIQKADFIFDHVNVVPMTRETVLSDRSVIVRDGKIVGITDIHTSALYTSAKHIDGRGRYLMPGLSDMHVHLRMPPQDFFDLNLAQGVTTVFNMGIADGGGKIDHLALRAGIAAGTMDGPRYLVSLYPYTRRYLPHFRNHFSTIGVNGMTEMVRNFTGDAYDVTDPSGIALCQDILDVMRARLKVYQEETGHLYNLEATPAEGTTYRFAKEDAKYYPGILQAGFDDNIYYTNSSQLPVGFTEDPFEALDLQDDLQCRYTGGTVLHLYMSERISSGEACKRLVRKVIENYRLPYITITPVFSVCETHGYLAGEQAHCPTCHKETLVWTRVMGYHRPVASFNLGKKGEHKERLHFREGASSLPLFRFEAAS